MSYWSVCARVRFAFAPQSRASTAGASSARDATATKNCRSRTTTRKSWKKNWKKNWKKSWSWNWSSSCWDSSASFAASSRRRFACPRRVRVRRRRRCRCRVGHDASSVASSFDSCSCSHSFDSCFDRCGSDRDRGGAARRSARSSVIETRRDGRRDDPDFGFAIGFGLRLARVHRRAPSLLARRARPSHGRAPRGGAPPPPVWRVPLAPRGCLPGPGPEAAAAAGRRLAPSDGVPSARASLPSFGPSPPLSAPSPRVCAPSRGDAPPYDAPLPWPVRSPRAPFDGAP